MGGSRPNGADRRQGRRWSFASCIFDENSWSLTVGGRRATIESKPLELLHELLLNAGNVVSKNELLDAIWPDVVVVEASLPTAVHKLRQTLGDEKRKKRVIETVSGIGYRFAVSVDVEVADAVPKISVVATEPAISERQPESGVAFDVIARRQRPAWVQRLLVVSSGLAVAFAAMSYVFAPSQSVSATASAHLSAQRGAPISFSQRDVEEAIRKLDIEKVEAMLAAGWDPNTPWNMEGTDALTMVLNICEWDPAHSRRQMLMMARTLIDGGAKIDRRNIFGDTAYSIAKADRYCGPDHPVTQMLEAICYGGGMGPRDLCLATYELSAEQRKAQGLPPKG